MICPFKYTHKGFSMAGYSWLLFSALPSIIPHTVHSRNPGESYTRKLRRLLYIHSCCWKLARVTPCGQWVLMNHLHGTSPMPLYPVVPGSALPTVGAQFTHWDSQQIPTKCLVWLYQGIEMTNAVMRLLSKRKINIFVI